MIKLINIIILLFFLLPTMLFSKQKTHKEIYLSAHCGLFQTSQSNFENDYGTRNLFSYGFGGGLQLFSKVHIYGEVTFFTKSGTSSYSIYNSSTGARDNKKGTSEFSQMIINGGLQYKFFLSNKWLLGLNGGITYTKIEENKRKEDGSELGILEGSGILGFFLGSVIERYIEVYPLSIFFEVDYNFPREDITNVIGDYGGLNLSVGIRYYFRRAK